MTSLQSLRLTWGYEPKEPKGTSIVLDSGEYHQHGFISLLFPGIVTRSEGKIAGYCQMTHYCYCFIAGVGSAYRGGAMQSVRI